MYNLSPIWIPGLKGSPRLLAPLGWTIRLLPLTATMAIWTGDPSGNAAASTVVRVG